MAKIEKPKARKEYKCSKCGEVIKVGDTYLKGTPFRMKPVIRCTKCGLRSWELSSSDYVQGVGRVCDCWEEDYGCNEDTAQSIVDELDSIKDQCQDSLDNMPYGLQEGDTGQLLQERIDNLESAISDLEAIDYDSIKTSAEQDFDSELEEGSPEYQNELAGEIETALIDAINEALSCLDY
jgi:DNA-directed RNA polymerase subunit RPC12/RpoP